MLNQVLKVSSGTCQQYVEVLSKSVTFLDCRLSQGSVGIYCRWGGNLCNVYIENFLTNHLVNEFWKSVHNFQSYYQTSSGLLFGDTVYIKTGEVIVGWSTIAVVRLLSHMINCLWSQLRVVEPSRPILPSASQPDSITKRDIERHKTSEHKQAGGRCRSTTTSNLWRCCYRPRRTGARVCVTSSCDVNETTWRCPDHWRTSTARNFGFSSRWDDLVLTGKKLMAGSFLKASGYNGADSVCTPEQWRLSQTIPQASKLRTKSCHFWQTLNGLPSIVSVRSLGSVAGSGEWRQLSGTASTTYRRHGGHRPAEAATSTSECSVKSHYQLTFKFSVISRVHYQSMSPCC